MAKKKAVRKSKPTAKKASASSRTQRASAKRRLKKAAAPAVEPTISSQNATAKWAKMDPAHSPGHRRMNHKNQADSKQVKSSVVRSQKVAPMNRRIITGAALGKTGQNPS